MGTFEKVDHLYDMLLLVIEESEQKLEWLKEFEASGPPRG